MSAPVAPEPHVCAVCGTPLDAQIEVNDATGAHEVVFYRHAYAATFHGEADHEPVPVPVGTVSTVGVCDFCGSRRPELVIPVDDFDMVALPGDVAAAIDKDVAMAARLRGEAPKDTTYGSHGGWSACRSCGRLVETRDWDRLALRVDAIQQRQGRGIPGGMGVTVLTQTYVELAKHISGPAQPL